MSETEIGSRRYRLAPPNPRAYDPSSLETVLAQGLAGPGANQLVGYMLGAQLDRSASADQYNMQLDNTNRQAMEAGRAADAADNLRSGDRLLSAFAGHPESAMLFGRTRGMIAPEARDVATSYTLAGRDALQGQAFQRYGAGAESMDAAGLRMPNGARTLPSGAPSVPLQQGPSRAERTASISGSGGGEGREGAADLRVRMAAVSHGRQVANAEMQAVLTSRGQTLDINGTIVPLQGRPPLTNAERNTLMAQRETRAAAEAQAYIQSTRPRAALPGQAQQPAAAPAPLQTPPPTQMPAQNPDIRGRAAAALGAPLRPGDSVVRIPGTTRLGVLRQGSIIKEFE